MNELKQIQTQIRKSIRNPRFDTHGDYNRIKHDILNMKRLTSQQKTTIQNMSSDDKMYVVLLYDNMMDWFEEISDLL
jgi:hypothetical protein